MITFRTSCSRCGTVTVPQAAIDLDENGYRFRCPGCARTQTRPAGPSVVQMLTAAGIKTAVADPITEDEIDRFVAALDDADWFERLRGLPGPR